MCLGIRTTILRPSLSSERPRWPREPPTRKGAFHAPQNAAKPPQVRYCSCCPWRPSRPCPTRGRRGGPAADPHDHWRPLEPIYRDLDKSGLPHRSGRRHRTCLHHASRGYRGRLHHRPQWLLHYLTEPPGLRETQRTSEGRGPLPRPHLAALTPLSGTSPPPAAPVPQSPLRVPRLRGRAAGRPRLRAGCLGP